MTFDASKYLVKVQGGRDYLEVKWRIVWLHQDHPSASIDTELVRIDDKQATVRACVSIPRADGITSTYSGYGVEQNDGKFPYVEKAETSAIGRALAHAGYGTQFTGLDEEGIVDSPRQAAQTQRSAQQAQPAATPPTQLHPIPDTQEAMRLIRQRLAAAELRDMGGIKLDIKQWGLDGEMEILAAFNARNHVLKGTAPAPAEQQGQQPLPNGDGPTPKQMKYLDVVARESGISDDELEARVMESFGVGLSGMTKRHVSTLIEQIQSERTIA